MALDEKALLTLAEQPTLDIVAEDAKPIMSAAVAELLSEGDLPTAALALGYRSATLSSAFFCGYQLAMRHLDESLKPDEFAAFAASEKGAKSSRDFSSRVITENTGKLLNGTKSHVMLAHQGILDFVYVLANDSDSELVCVKVKTSRDGIEPLCSDKPQPFVKDVPHSPLKFNNVVCETDYFLHQAHQRCFKPFRFWEDVMVGLSFSGWMLRHCQSDSLKQTLLISAAELSQAYRVDSQYYTSSSIDAIEHTLKLLSRCNNELSDLHRKAWQQDNVVLMLGAAAREKVKTKLLA